MRGLAVLGCLITTWVATPVAAQVPVEVDVVPVEASDALLAHALRATLVAETGGRAVSAVPGARRIELRVHLERERVAIAAILRADAGGPVLRRLVVRPAVSAGVSTSVRVRACSAALAPEIRLLASGAPVVVLRATAASPYTLLAP